MGQGRRPARPMMRWSLVALAAVTAVLVLAPAALANGGVAPLWSTTWNAKTPGVVTNVHVAKTPTGEIYTACSLLRATTGKYDVIVARYRANGTREWVKSWSRGTSYDDMVEGIAVDPDGRLVVCGWSATGKDDGTPDWSILKFGRVGNLLWSKSIGSAFGGDDRAVDVVINKYGRIYVTGYVTQSSSGKDWRTVKLKPTGAQVWSVSYKCSEGLDDQPAAMAIDAEGNLYVTGWAGTAKKVRRDAVTIRYGRDGTRAWVMRFHDGGEEMGVDVAVRLSGVAVAVKKIDENAQHTYALAKQYTRDGDDLWTATLDDANTVTDEFLCAGIDSSARGVFGGFSIDEATADSSARLSQYNASGVSEWSFSQSAAGALPGDQFNDLFVAISGTTWATGSIGGHAVTWSFDAAGAQRWYGWTGVYDTVNATSGDAMSVTSKYVYVAGRSGDSLVLMKYVR